MTLQFQPGDLVKEFARRNGWPVRAFNLMVEGESDRAYLTLADSLYRQRHGRTLLGEDLSVFPPGDAHEGGTYGIQRHYPALCTLIDSDLSPELKRLFRVAVLVDNDLAGNRAASALTGTHSQFRLWRDVFILQRRFPLCGGELRTVKETFRRENERWKTLDCEVEDLINPELVDWFLEENDFYRVSFKEHDGERHYALAAHIKPPLLRFVKEKASLEDVNGLVSVLSGIRFYFGLEPNGSTAL